MSNDSVMAGSPSEGEWRVTLPGAAATQQCGW
jgi:hypothetical protein